MKICGLICVKDSRPLLAAAMNHMALNGISDFYIMDHGSEPKIDDSLLDELRLDCVRVQVCRKTSPQFFQRWMIGGLMELARIDGFDVAVGFDADEFWCSTEERSLAEQISWQMRTDADALTVPVVNYVQHRNVDAFSEKSLLECRYRVIPSADETRSVREQVEDGMPFVAMPFPDKVIVRLRPGIRFTEGQHGVSTDDGVVVAEAEGIVVRHLSVSSRQDLVVKQEQGRRRIAAGFGADIGWQLQRLAAATDEELDAYWANNSWQLAEDGTPCVGSYTGLTEDDGLVTVGARLLAEPERCRKPADGDRAQVSRMASERIESLLESLIDEAGAAELAVIRRDERIAGLSAQLADAEARRADAEDHLRALQREFEERTTWALQLDRQVSDLSSELTRVKSSPVWRTYTGIRHPRKALDHLRSHSRE